MKIFIEQTDERTPLRWEDINWRNVEKNVRRLQERIYRATERQDWKRVRSLQKLLVRTTWLQGCSRLEPDEPRGSRPVLRGLGRRNAPQLPGDAAQDVAWTLQLVAGIGH
ncbi:MAG: hypothetical protein MAG451_01175 [Anaerolineales bacterium]|nr:hypothetical protein [Anaerolineales bacterium]